ncbi:MFS transporter [Peterkaempfera sp. SMS 1(5)a]|uniref:MFS transporter n=1 Tax=Peterkaempfera podocarpi TaxID=3232308 RepID=UPI00366FADB3
MKRFLIIWPGLALTMLGGGASGFCLSLWVYQQTGSATGFAVSLLCGYLPGILAAPFAGRLVDRCRRSRVLAASELLTALTTVLLTAALLGGFLGVIPVYCAEVVNSLIAAASWPALAALVGDLVDAPEQHRAAAMVQLAVGLAQTCGPLLGAALFPEPGLTVVLALDAATSLITAGIVLVTLRRDTGPAAGRAAHRASDGAKPDPRRGGGWTVIAANRTLRSLLALAVVQNLATAAVQVLMVPLILATHDGSPVLLGAIAASCGLGMITGSAYMSLRRRVGRPARWIGAAGALAGTAVAVGSLVPRPPTVIIAAFALYCSLPVANSLAQTIWQREVDPDQRGRAFSTRQMLVQCCMPAACLLIAPLADGVFEPLLRRDGALAGTLGRYTGVGPGHGTGLLLGLCGLALSVSSLTLTARGLRGRPGHPDPDQTVEELPCPPHSTAAAS